MRGKWRRHIISWKKPKWVMCPSMKTLLQKTVGFNDLKLPSIRMFQQPGKSVKYFSELILLKNFSILAVMILYSTTRKIWVGYQTVNFYRERERPNIYFPGSEVNWKRLSHCDNVSTRFWNLFIHTWGERMHISFQTVPICINARCTKQL